MNGGLPPERLSALSRALVELDNDMAHAERLRLGWWAMRASWELDHDRVMWCLVDATRFIEVGGHGWSLLGYDTERVRGTPWSQYLGCDEDVVSSRMIVDTNLASGRGVSRFVNTYRHADGLGRSTIEWAVSPWVHGHAVARGIVQ